MVSSLLTRATPWAVAGRSPRVKLKKVKVMGEGDKAQRHSVEKKPSWTSELKVNKHMVLLIIYKKLVGVVLQGGELL